MVMITLCYQFYFCFIYSGTFSVSLDELCSMTYFPLSVVPTKLSSVFTSASSLFNSSACDSWFICPTPMCVGRDSSVNIATLYGLDGPGQNPGWCEISRTLPDRPWGTLIFLCNGYLVSFPGVKRPRHDINHPYPSAGEIKERVEIYPYWISGPLRPVLGRNLPSHDCALFSCAYYLSWLCWTLNSVCILKRLLGNSVSMKKRRYWGRRYLLRTSRAQIRRLPRKDSNK